MLNAPEPGRAQKEGEPAGLKRRAAVTELPLRRDAFGPEEREDEQDLDEGARERRRPAVRVSFRGGVVPKTLWGRIAAGVGFVLVAGGAVASAMAVRSYVLHDEHFVVPGADAIEIAGASHLTRAQLLSVFGEDVDRNVFEIPLAERRAELESLPWVEHATVMRLLPDKVRVAIVERTPVAFVRQGSHIGLVDRNGVLFDLPTADAEEASGGKGVHYSFPVLTGIEATDPLSTREARVRIYLDFMAALDATGEGLSKTLSEVDVSNPEDVKAIIPDGGASPADILVHFGEEKYLARYHTYKAHLAEWRAQFPRLASVDMRYEQQVVLEMQPGEETANAGNSGETKPETKEAAAAHTAVSEKAAKAKAGGPAHAKATATARAQGGGE